jgi:hypothetical protein
MKFAADRPYADPEAAVQDGRIFIELINGPMLCCSSTRPRRRNTVRD